MNDSALIKLDAAQHALAECKTVMEAKQIADVAEAARVYLERTNASVETVNRAAEIRTLAERQMGAFLKQMPKNEGTAGAGRPKIGGASAEPPKDSTPTLASSPRQSSEDGRVTRFKFALSFAHPEPQCAHQRPGRIGHVRSHPADDLAHRRGDAPRADLVLVCSCDSTHVPHVHIA